MVTVGLEEHVLKEGRLAYLHPTQLTTLLGIVRDVSLLLWKLFRLPTNLEAIQDK